MSPADDWTLTLDEVVDAITADPAFREDPAPIINGLVSRAASLGPDHAAARRTTWIACRLVDAAHNPNIVRGQVLDQLVRRYGEPR